MIFEKSGFQSTPPMQGATICHSNRKRRSVVSIHAPYAGSDVKITSTPKLKELEFQSTPPMQGATLRARTVKQLPKYVSIHAPYAGSDIIS